jgi:hypothetical protein
VIARGWRIILAVLITRLAVIDANGVYAHSSPPLGARGPATSAIEMQDAALAAPLAHTVADLDHRLGQIDSNSMVRKRPSAAGP